MLTIIIIITDYNQLLTKNMFFVAAPNEQCPLRNNGRGSGSARDMSPGDTLVALGHAIYIAILNRSL